MLSRLYIVNASAASLACLQNAANTKTNSTCRFFKQQPLVTFFFDCRLPFHSHSRRANPNSAIPSKWPERRELAGRELQIPKEISDRFKFQKP